MDVRGLRQIVALADIRNYRRAAQRLGVTHSALSLAITKLETHYKVPLFERGKGETLPTAFGRRMVEAARIALEEIERAERDLELMQNMEAGRLVVGVDPTVSVGLLAPTLVELLKTWPKLRFNVVVRNWLTMADDLRSSSIDVFVGMAPERSYSGITCIPLLLKPPIAVCRSDHPLTKEPRVTIQDVAEYPMLGGEAPDWFLGTIQEAYPENFPSLDSLRSIFLTSQDLDLIRSIIPSTNAVALIPTPIAAQGIKSGRLVELTIEGNPFVSGIPGVLATLDARPLPPAAEQLIARISELSPAPPEIDNEDNGEGE